MKKLYLILVLVLCCSLCACNTEEPSQNRANPEAPETFYTVTEEERVLLAKLVFCEANTENLDCQKAVVSVVFNRLEAGKWGSSLDDVIFYPNAFTPATFGFLEDAKPTAENYEAVDYVLKNGPTLPTYVRYFRSGYHFSWENYEGYIVLDSTYFGYFKGWRQGEW